MTDTIELLETIGRDASLRYASADQLGVALASAQASDGLRLAATSGDGAQLRAELNIQQVPQVPQSHLPGYGDDGDREDEVRPPAPSAPPEPAPSTPPAESRTPH